MQDLKVGSRLPSLNVPITARLVVAGAIATRDFQAVHHDRDAATDAGAKDIFMNILTTNGLVGRFVTDWAGSKAVLDSINIRLGAPNHPGDTMVLRGEVSGVDNGTAQVEIEGKNSLGTHVTGTVLVRFGSKDGARV